MNQLPNFRSANCVHTILFRHLRCKSASRRFQPGEGPSRGLLCDCEIFANYHLKLYCPGLHGPLAVDGRRLLLRRVRLPPVAGHGRGHHRLRGAGPAPHPPLELRQLLRQGAVLQTRELQQQLLELEMKAIRRFAKVSIVSYSFPSLMTIASASQFHVYLPWGQHLFSIVS